MWKRIVMSLAVVTLGLVWAAGSRAQQPVVVIDPDQQFMIQAAQGGTAEVEMEQLAPLSCSGSWRSDGGTNFTGCPR